MKKKFLFLIMTLLAFVASSPHANAWELSNFNRIVGWNIANPASPTTNLEWQSLPLVSGSVDFVALGSDAYISLVTTDNKKVGNNNAEVKVNGITDTFYNNDINYSVGDDPGDYYKLHLTGMTTGSTYTFTIAIDGGNPKVTSFKLKSYPVLYLRGEFNSNGTTHKMECDGNGVYTISNINMNKDQKWKICDNNWNNAFDATKIANITINGGGKAYNPNDYSNIAVDAALVNATFTYDSNAKSLIIDNNVSATIPSFVNMPLKPSDFAGGKAHYFLVGFRTAGWRLQPEWELEKTGANTYALPANQRLMYNQYFGIAKVDNYVDYIHQRYTMYYQAQFMVKSDTPDNIALNASRPNEGYQPGVTAEWANTKDNCMLWSRDLNVGDPHKDIMNENTIRWSYPSVLTKFQITVNSSGVPITLDIQSTQTPAEVVKHRAFTLVGDGIRSTTQYDINGTKKTVDQATYTVDKLNTQGWQSPWVQYDADGKPYIDGNGHVVYQTAFDADYLPKHPSKFDYKLDDVTTFSYNSNRITFVDASTFSDEQLAKDEYADLYKMFDGVNHDFTDNGTHTNGKFQYKEIWNDPGSGWAKDGNGNDVTTNSSYTNSNWKCFVVKDMWMKGSFKIWSGWGGNIKYGEGHDVGWESGSANDVVRNSARWFPDNGGHATEETPKAVQGGIVTGTDAQSNVYGMRMDVEGADFQIEGSDNDLRYYKRVILWYPGDKCGFNSAVLQLVIDEGGPTIQAQSKDNAYLGYRWNIPQGGTTTDVVDSYTIIRRNIATGQTITVEKKTGQQLKPGDRVIFTNWTFETNKVQPGEYEYEITIHYKDTNSTKSAISNPVHIFAEAQPVLLKAEQYMEGDLYAFDLVLTPTLRENELNRTVNSKTGLSMAKTVVITPADDYTKKAMDTMREAACPEGWKQSADRYTYTYTLPDDKTGLTIAPITLCDIAPNAGLEGVDDQVYSFNVELTSDDTDWGQLSYVSASASTHIFAPTVDINIDQPTIVKIDTQEERDDIADKYADVTDTQALLPAGSHTPDGRIENPALYTLFNEVRATATIDPLKVTQAVKNSWGIDYNFTVNNKDKVTLKNGTPTNVVFHGLPNSGVASAQVAVTYTRPSDKTTYNALVKPGSSQNFNITFPEPVFTTGEKTWFQRDYAEPNNASPLNNRTLAFAQFDGTVSGIRPNLNYYVGFNFTDDAVADIVKGLSELLSTGDANGNFKDEQLYWKVINNMAARGGRVIGRRKAGVVANTGKFVDELPFDYLDNKLGKDCNDEYIMSWTVATNSWTEAFKAENNRLPVEVGPIAVGEYGTDITIPTNTINGTVNVIYPIVEGIAVTDETPAPAQQRAGAAAAESLYAPAIVDIANIKPLSSAEAKATISIEAGNKVTGIEQISADTLDADADAEVYNLQGIRIYNPAPGNVYIVRRGATVAKVLCK